MTLDSRETITKYIPGNKTMTLDSQEKDHYIK